MTRGGRKTKTEKQVESRGEGKKQREEKSPLGSVEP